MKPRIAAYSLAALFLTFTSTGAAANLTVSYQNGQLTVRCADVPLEQVFAQIKATTGMELILEDAVKNTRLTASIEAQPLRLAIERLLAGSGVNYAMFFDLQDWQKVDKIFIGGGGGGPATPARQPAARTPTRGRPAPADDQYEEDMMEEEDDFEDMEDFGNEEPPPEPAADTPGYLPPAPSFPRSSFTPGLESNPYGATSGGQGGGASPEPETGEAENPPPAYYPFLDPLGRPIPVPPGANPQQQQKKKQ